MMKTNDNYLKRRQEETADLIKQLEKLDSSLPVARIVISNIVRPLNHIIQKLAFYVGDTYMLIENEQKTRRKTDEHLGFITDIVFPLHNQMIALKRALSSLTDEVRSLKGKADKTQLDKIQKDLEGIEKELEERIRPRIRDIENAKEQKKKWLMENK
ncbi:MAG: hypothetical protein NWE91_07150 [Candidatus Bathyarchaeota archaeon]|nr:hypothetical protein [Candidatus Bathyarchaeota archaeon]